MKHTNLAAMQCPIARGLDRVGEWWSILILRDAFHGLTRFDEFRRSLGIATNMLARRLQWLVEAGVLERRRYQENPPRDEYVLTDRGRDFREVLLALLAWGNRHLAPEGPSVVVVDRETGAVADLVLVDRVSGRSASHPAFHVVAGQAADAKTRQRYDEVERRAVAAVRAVAVDAGALGAGRRECRCPEAVAGLAGHRRGNRYVG